MKNSTLSTPVVMVQLVRLRWKFLGKALEGVVSVEEAVVFITPSSLLGV